MAKDQTIRITAQCAFEQKGKKCTRKTTLTHPYCARHTKELLGVEVRPSQIRAAGLGLWATRDFPKGAHLFNYEGERLKTREYDERYADEAMGVYGIKLTSRTVIDARRTDSGVARYICSYQGSGKKPNIEYQSTSKVIEMVTTRAIKAGEELLGDYGDEMIAAMGVPNKA
ncbi:MAG: SET domain-containing protein [Candidatus Kapaibacterium sp.]|jgi:histone-lysine N-methyltransferase EZH2